MDFYDWLSDPTDSFTPDLSKLSLPDAEIDENALQWNEYAWDAFDDTVPVPASDCSSNSPAFSRSNSYATQSDRSVTEGDNVGSSEALSCQDIPITCEKDTTLNRIQRRRTQNRNSQRVYRQRRIDERRLFEARAIAAEEASRHLGARLRELQSMVASLRRNLQQLEAENLALRSSSYSMPWRKSSLQS